MAERANHGEVKYKVRRCALLLKKFRVEDVVSATRLNPESIRTELQRMKREGFLVTEPTSNDENQRGAPPVLYILTSDPEARLRLARSIESFESEVSMLFPTSRQYVLAQALLDDAQIADDEERETLLKEATTALELAEAADAHNLGDPTVKASFEFERGRLAYLACRHEEAEARLQAAYDVFDTADIRLIATRIEEFLLCLRIQPLANLLHEARGSSIREHALHIINAITEQEYQITSPLALIFYNLVQRLATPIEETVVSVAQEVTERTLDVRKQRRRASQASIEVLFPAVVVTSVKQQITRYGPGHLASHRARASTALPYPVATPRSVLTGYIPFQDIWSDQEIEHTSIAASERASYYP